MLVSLMMKMMMMTTTVVKKYSNLLREVRVHERNILGGVSTCCVLTTKASTSWEV